MKKGKIIIICGPSGVGKGTIIRQLIADKNLNIALVPTITTRAPRETDKLTNHYKYIAKKQFAKELSEDNFLEHNIYNDNYYGTYKKDIDDIINNGKIGVLEQDVDHALYTQKHYPKETIIIFITSSLEIIEQRLIGRGENSPEQIKERLKLGAIELDKKHKCDYNIENIQDKLEIAVNKIKNIIGNL